MRSVDDDGDDRELIERFLGGDERGFEALMDKYYARVDRLALRVLGDGAAAEEVAQEVFVRAYRALPRFRGDASIFSWLYRITVNLCLNYLHRRTRSAIPPEVAATQPDVIDPASRLESEQRRAIVRRAVGALPPHYRIVIVLSGAEDLSYQEIADLLGIPVGTVKSRINFAKRLLREKLLPLLGPA